MLLGVGVSPRKLDVIHAKQRSGVLRRDTLPFLNCAKDLLVPHHTTMCPASYRRGGDFAETDGARAEELCLFAPTSRLRREACSSLTIQTYPLVAESALCTV